MSAPAPLRTAVIVAVAAGLGVAGCGGGGDDKPKPAKSSTAVAPSTTPPPGFTAEQVKSALVTAAETGSGMKPLQLAVTAMVKKQAPMCSLSAAALPGSPEVTTRQFGEPDNLAKGKAYAQLVARYPDVTAAEAAYTALKTKALACPKKQHIPQKKYKDNLFFAAHDDTWKVTQDTVAGWTHLRGFEQSTVGDFTKKNIIFYAYDYAWRGNVVLATLYWRRTDPGDKGTAIAKASSDLLGKQLQKIG